MPHVKAHWRAAGRRVAQPLQPRAQQRRGLHLGRKHAARRADKGFDAQPRRPFARGVGPEVAQPIRHGVGLRTVATDEGGQRLGMRQVEPALARQQELAADGGHGIEHIHRDACAGEHLGRHQAGGAGADDEAWGVGGVMCFCRL